MEAWYVLSCPSISLLFMHRDPSRAAGGRIYIPSSIWYSVRIRYMYRVIQNKITSLSLFPSPQFSICIRVFSLLRPRLSPSNQIYPTAGTPAKSGGAGRRTGQIWLCSAVLRPDLAVLRPDPAMLAGAHARSKGAPAWRWGAPAAALARPWAVDGVETCRAARTSLRGLLTGEQRWSSCAGKGCALAVANAHPWPAATRSGWRCPVACPMAGQWSCAGGSEARAPPVLLRPADLRVRRASVTP